MILSNTLLEITKVSITKEYNSKNNQINLLEINVKASDFAKLLVSI